MKREPLSRGEKMVAGGSVVFVASLLVAVTWWQRVNEEPKIDFPTVAELPWQNGFDLYTRAGKRISGWTPAIDPVYDSEIVTDPKLRAQRYGLARREAWLKANAAGFALFKQATVLPCRCPSNRGKSGFQMQPFGQLRQMVRWKTCEINTLKLRGD